MHIQPLVQSLAKSSHFPIGFLLGWFPHGIIVMWLGKGLQDHQVQPLTQVYPQTMSPCPISTHPLNASKAGVPTAALDSLFQCLTTFSVKMIFLIVNLNFP